jgi:hypothetical protein
LTAGRHRKTGNEVCSCCGQLCFPYVNSVKKSTKNIFFYLRSRHNDRSIKDHDIDKKVENSRQLQHAIEYNRKINEATLYSFKSYDNDKYYPLKHANSENKVLPIIIYDLVNISTNELEPEINDEFRQLRESELTISEQERNWLLDLEAVKQQVRVKQFYEDILNDISPKRIVTFGEKAVQAEGKILKFSFTGEAIKLLDKYGMLSEILKMREWKKKLSQSCSERYNHPQRTLQELVTQTECKD